MAKSLTNKTFIQITNKALIDLAFIEPTIEEIKAAIKFDEILFNKVWRFGSPGA